MTRRGLLAAVMVLGIVTGIGPLRAEDTPKPAGGDKPAPAAEPEKKKDKFFGDHFALYLETRGGTSSFRDVENPVKITEDQNTQSTVALGDGTTGQFTIGWTLPRERGQYLFTYTGVSDGKYTLDATGYQRSYTSTPSAPPDVVPTTLPWWHIRVDDGVLHTTQTPPFWDPLVNDTNGNGHPDPGEMVYPTTVFDLTKPVASKLNSKLATYDLHYRREFGGVRYRARWTAGLRYFTFDGTLPTPTWLNQLITAPGVGFSDGIQNLYLMLSQKTRGWGPLGSGEVDFNFDRKRFQIYLLAQAGFLLENLDTDSGPFTYLATVTGGSGSDLVPGLGQITRSVSKSAWHTMIEAGFRVRILEGFHGYIAINRTGYLDALLVPTILSVPANNTQQDQGVSAVYNTRDIVVSTLTVGLTFQF